MIDISKSNFINQYYFSTTVEIDLMEKGSINLLEIKGENIIFNSIFKNEFKNWNLKDSITLTPEAIDGILLQNITKVKIYKQQPVQGHYMVKIEESVIQQEKQQHLYAVSWDNHRLFFQRLMMNRLRILGLQQFDMKEDYGFELSDDGLKKSQIRGNWQPRTIKINNTSGLTSKKLDKQKETLHIKNSKQIWSRFELLQNGKYFVMKVKYMIGKQEFGLPTKDAGKWVRAFYTLFLQ